MSIIKKIKSKLFGGTVSQSALPQVERLKTLHIELRKFDNGHIAAPRNILLLIQEGYDIIGTVKHTREQFALSLKNNILVLNPIL